MKERHPVTVQAPTTERGWAAYWGDECLYAIRDALARPDYQTTEDLAMLHAVRSAHLAAWHANKALGTWKEPKT